MGGSAGRLARCAAASDRRRPVASSVRQWPVGRTSISGRSGGGLMKLRLLLVAASLCAGCAAQPATTPAAEAPASGTVVPITSKSPEAVEHLKKGEVLLDNLRVDEAQREFDAALKL